MTPDHAVPVDAAGLVTRFCRARLADADRMAPAVLARVLGPHSVSVPDRVSVLRLAAHEVAAVIHHDRPAPGSMQALLTGLPTLQADVLAMRVAVGATVEEVSAALSIPVAAVLIAQHRGLCELRATMAP